MEEDDDDLPVEVWRERVLDEVGSADVGVAARALLSLTYHDPDRPLVERTLLRCQADEEREAHFRQLAVTCMGHLGRMRGALGRDVVGRLHELLRSEVFGGVAEDALDDTAAVTGWRSCFTLVLPSRPWVVIAPAGDVETGSQIAVLESAGHVVRRASARDVRAPGDPFEGLRGDSGVFCFVLDHAEALEGLGFFPRLVSVLCDVADRANTPFDDEQADDRPETVLHFVLSGASAERSEEVLACLRGEGRTVTRCGEYLLVG